MTSGGLSPTVVAVLVLVKYQMFVCRRWCKCSSLVACSRFKGRSKSLRLFSIEEGLPIEAENYEHTTRKETLHVGGPFFFGQLVRLVLGIDSMTLKTVRR